MLEKVLKKNYYNYSLKYKYMQINESERPSRRQRDKFAFKFRKQLAVFCLIRKIIPPHCTTILFLFLVQSWYVAQRPPTWIVSEA